MDNSLGYVGSPVVRLRPNCCSRNEYKLISGSPAEIDWKLTGVLDDEILKHPEKQLYKTNFFKDTLSIGDVDDGDNSTPFR